MLRGALQANRCPLLSRDGYEKEVGGGGGWEYVM